MIKFTAAYLLLPVYLNSFASSGEASPQRRPDLRFSTVSSLDTVATRRVVETTLFSKLRSQSADGSAAKNAPAPCPKASPPNTTQSAKHRNHHVRNFLIFAAGLVTFSLILGASAK